MWWRKPTVYAQEKAEQTPQTQYLAGMRCLGLHYTPAKLSSVIIATNSWLLSCICQLIQVQAVNCWCGKWGGVALNSFYMRSLMSNKWVNVWVNTHLFIWQLLQLFLFSSMNYRNLSFSITCCCLVADDGFIFCKFVPGTLCWNMKQVQTIYVISKIRKAQFYSSITIG